MSESNPSLLDAAMVLVPSNSRRATPSGLQERSLRADKVIE